MLSDKKIFATGTMRTGGSLLINSLSLHSEITIFNERVNFFRFFYDFFEDNNKKNTDRLLSEYSIRLKHRSNINFDAQEVLENIMKRGCTKEVCYDELMNDLLKQTKKRIWGEYANLSWRRIPDFLKMFPNGKVIHVCRDLRGVLASYGALSFLPDNLYLNCIFNWIDSIKYINENRKKLSDNNFMVIKFEDFHSHPLKIVKSICNFLDIKFEDVMIQDSTWKDKINENLIKVNVSAHTKKKVYGFNPERSDAWKNILNNWELALCDNLAGEYLEQMGYEKFFKSIPSHDLEIGLDKLNANQYLKTTFINFKQTGICTDEYPVNPADPENWSAPNNGFLKFKDSPAYKNYLKDMKALKIRLGKE